MTSISVTVFLVLIRQSSEPMEGVSAKYLSQWKEFLKLATSESKFLFVCTYDVTLRSSKAGDLYLASTNLEYIRNE